MTNLIIPRYADLGKAAAEDDDDFFGECFIDTGLIDRILSPNSPISVIVGRTGSGKSALIRRIRGRLGRCLDQRKPIESCVCR